MEQIRRLRLKGGCERNMRGEWVIGALNCSTVYKEGKRVKEATARNILKNHCETKKHYDE